MLARNVLIFHSAALGDFILTWPLGLALGRLFPQSRIIYVTQRQKCALAEKVLRLDSADIESGWHHLFGDPAQLPAPNRKMLEGSHAVFTFLAKPDDPWLQSASSIAPRADILPIDTQLTAPGDAHISDRLLASLASHPAIQASVCQILSAIAANGIGFPRSPQPGRILLHPGSGSKEKCWPLESFLQLANRLKRDDHQPHFLLGEVELDRWPAETIRKIESTFPTTRPATYLDLLTQLSTATTFLGNDSGPGHLASIIGIPTVILFGPTNPKIWNPLGPRVTTLSHHPLSDLRADEVHRALSTAISN